MCLVCPTPCAVRLGITGAEHTHPCWYLCWYLFRTVLRSACTVLRLVRTGDVPTCPCSHLYRYLLCSWTARALYLLARVLNVPTCPCLYRTYVSVLVSLYSVLVWVTRAMYVSSCLDSCAVTVSLLPLTWTCICAGCLYLTCRGAIVCLPVCTANREGWQPRLIYTMYIIHNDFHVLCSTSSVVGVR